MADEKDKRASKPRKEWSPTEAEKQHSEDESNQTGRDVEPITVVRNKPEEGNEESERVEVLNKPNLQESGKVMVSREDEEKNRKDEKDEKDDNVETCWNCGEDLDDKGVCKSCGFEKDKLENADLNAQRSREARMRMVREGTL